MIELLIVVAIIGIIAAMAVVVLGGMEQRARVARAQADLRAMATAASMYGAHMGAPPPSLAALTGVATNAQGEAAGPFLVVVPTRAAVNWTDYAAGYVVDVAAGTFAITASGDGATVSVP